MSAQRPLPLVRAVVAGAPSRDERARLVRRARLLARGGIAWHVVEFAVAIAAGLAASSIALIGFGIDSLIESLAGLAVVWLFAAPRAGSAAAERRAQQLIAASFAVLAVYVAVSAVRALLGGDEPSASLPGIALAAVTAPAMPLLARAKTRVGRALGSQATISEGAQNMLCAYLSIALLVGLGANAALGWWWADPIAGLAVAGAAVLEARRAWRGEADACCGPVPAAAATCTDGCCDTA